MKLSATLTLACCVALLGGCANPRALVPGESTGADARARLGAPADRHTAPNGDELWDYPTGPEGYETYRVRVGADGKVKEVTQLLTEDQLAKVEPGKMTGADVRALLGRPGWDLALYSGQSWSWRFHRVPSSPGYLVVSFNPDGTVKDKIAVIDPAGGDRSK